MKFKEAFDLWTQGVDVRAPLCNEHKDNLFERMVELMQTPGIDVTRFEYYKLYLESCGETDKPRKPFICFSIYVNIYAKIFEADLRRGLVRRPDTNEIHCRLFNIPGRYFGTSFDTIKDVPEQKQVIQTARNWIEKGWNDSLLLGSKVPGIVKTTTAVCTAMQRFIDFDLTEIKRFEGGLEFLNSSIVFIKERELISILNQPGIYRGQILGRLATVDYLIYDDMFAVADKRFIREVLTDLIDSRVDSDGSPMAITTRYPLEDLKRYQPDIYSRLSRGVIYYSNSKVDLRRNG